MAAHLDGSWAIVDCRFDLKDTSWGIDAYRKGHIPGAVYASLKDDLSGPLAGSGGRHPLPAAAAMAATFGRLGIAPGMQVIAYDEDNGIFASRLWWMLRYMAHDAVAVLDGGWAKWMREGRPVRTDEERRPAAVFTGRPRGELRMPVEDVEARVGDPSVLLVDARSPERFQGSSEPLDRDQGHKPGAVNHF